MMATRSVTLNTDATAHPCPCGCAPCDGTCCQLDCLERPRFFCGQLLTDQDLTALIGWTQDKLRLARFRDGWGVVCGLEVRCDPQQPGQVIVAPGYAVSCCGDDIVVCEDTPFDLGDACRKDPDPCAELRKPGKVEDMGSKLAFAGREMPARQVRAVDLYIRYREELADPQTAFGRSACREVAECEYARTREVFSLAWRPAVTGSDPLQAVATRWHQAYEKCMDVVVRFRAHLTSYAWRGEEVREWLLRWIADRPLNQFCFLRDRICEMTAEALANESEVVKLLFWLVQDCRNGFLACRCHACTEDHGVPLARVWLDATEVQGAQRCRILAIDAYPPYRRPVDTECWPAPLGAVNVGQVIWHRWEEACTRLAEMGVQVASTESFALPATLADLEKALECGLFVPCQEPRVVQVYDAGELGQRVVGFCGTAAPPSRVGVSVAKRSVPAESVPIGQTVVYTFEMTNTGDVPLVVAAEDDLLGLIASDVRLAPGAMRRLERNFQVRRGVGDELTNQVKVIGTAANGGTATASAVHSLKVTRGEPVPGDDLTVIEGIGSVRAEQLRRAGITTFAALAATPIERLR